MVAALDVFFRNSSAANTDITNLQEEDFHQRNTGEPIRITLTFADLSPEAKEDLKHYQRQGRLIVVAEAHWNDDQRCAPVLQHGNRLAMEKLAPYFEKEKANAKAMELKQVYQELRKEFTSLPKAISKADMAEALRAYEEAHPEKCVEIPSGDQFYGATQGRGVLSKYIQWVHVPAVKDACDEDTESKNSWLGQLLTRTVRSKVQFDDHLKAIKDEAQSKYEEMLANQQATLEDLSKSLTSRMGEWAHPDATVELKWDTDSAKSVSITQPFARIRAGDSSFVGCLSRQGHGFQRSYLLALLQELISSGDQGPTLLLACEEPELYQHPPQARHLARVFCELSGKGSQVIVSTHSPHFVSGRGFPDIRMVRRKRSQHVSDVSWTDFEKLAERLKEATGKAPANPAGMRIKLNQALQPSTNELFFSPVVVAVEGLEDLAYITAHLALSDKIDEFRRLGCHIVPVNGKHNLVQFLAVGESLGIPVFTVFDADVNLFAIEGDTTKEEVKKREKIKTQHIGDNKAILGLCNAADQSSEPDGDVWLDNLVMWRDCIGSAIEKDFGTETLATARAAVRQTEKLSEKSLNKNTMFVGLVLEKLWADEKKSATLEGLCTAILQFAKTASSN